MYSYENSVLLSDEKKYIISNLSTSKYLQINKAIEEYPFIDSNFGKHLMY